MQEASFTVPVLLVIEKSLAILLHPISSYPSLKNRFNDILPLPGYREKKKNDDISCCEKYIWKHLC